MTEQTIEADIESIDIQTGGLTADEAKVTFENGLSLTVLDSDHGNDEQYSTENFAALKDREESDDLGSAKVGVYTSSISPESRCALKDLV